MNNILPPKDIYDNIRDWIATVPNDTSYDKILYQTIYPATPFFRQILHPPTQYPKYLDEGYVAQIPNGRIWGKNGAVVTPDNHLLWDVSLEFVYPRTNHSIFKQGSLPPVSHFYNRIADLTHTGAGNYYHWMYETIPRVELIRQGNIDVDSYIVNYAPEHYPYQAETLNYLGISSDQIVTTHHNLHIQAENLIVPSQPSFATKWSYDFLRKTFLTDDKLDEKKRIYISRKNAQYSRKIVNEDSIMEILANFGFVKVELENLSIAEQVKLFSSADVIIGAHGAGFVNLTFCEPGTRILEIFSPTYITPLYWVISSFGNLKYNCFIGKKDPSQPAKKWSGLDDIQVDLREFTKTLRKMRLQ